MSGFRRRPGNPDPQQLEDFLSEAATSTTEKEAPLEEEEARIKTADDTRLARSVNFRMTEKELQQLQYISKHAGISINSFIRLAVKEHLPKAMAVAKKRKRERLI